MSGPRLDTLTPREKELVAAITSAIMQSVEPMVSRMVGESTDVAFKMLSFMVTRGVKDSGRFYAEWLNAKTTVPSASFEDRLELAFKGYTANG